MFDAGEAPQMDGTGPAVPMRGASDPAARATFVEITFHLYGCEMTLDGTRQCVTKKAMSHAIQAS